MILVDTSVWIEFLKQNSIFAYEVEVLLKKRMVVAFEPVFAELLFGARNDKERNKILSYWKILPRIDFSAGCLLDAVDLANRSNFHKQGIGLIDAAIIRATKKNHYKIWTLDNKLLKGMEKQYLYPGE
ncbi:MAG: PIN domain-containing protein [Bacteroidales bacterium]|nr:PIN domain-containing protein [Bacteroidales bacterium]